MSKAYISNITTHRVVDKPMTVARISVPKGKYIISGKLYIKAVPIKDVLLVEQIIGAKLICGREEDEVLLSIFPRNPSFYELSNSIQRFYNNDKDLQRFYPYAGQFVVLPFNLAVNLEQSENIELTVISGHSGGIRVESANITALEVDELTISKDIPRDELDGGGAFRFRAESIQSVLDFVKLNKEIPRRRRGLIRRVFEGLFG